MTDDPDNSDFEYMAHCRGNTQKDMFYVGAYLGFVADNKLRSLSGKTVTGNMTFPTYNGYARNNSPASDGNGGSGYDLFAWYQIIFIQCMYVLKYKNLNSQATIGNGNHSHTSSVTGGTETKGMDWGDTVNTNQPMKLFGIEHLWGYYWQYAPGVRYAKNTNNECHIYTGTENFYQNWNGVVSYIDRGATGVGGLTRYWTTKIVGTTHGGFFGTSVTGGSEITYYCDWTQSGENNLLRYGGSWYESTYSNGIFWVNFDGDGVHYREDSASRLMYV